MERHRFRSVYLGYDDLDTAPIGGLWHWVYHRILPHFRSKAWWTHAVHTKIDCSHRCSTPHSTPHSKYGYCSGLSLSMCSVFYSLVTYFPIQSMAWHLDGPWQTQHGFGFYSRCHPTWWWTQSVPWTTYSLRSSGAKIQELIPKSYTKRNCWWVGGIDPQTAGYLLFSNHRNGRSPMVFEVFFAAQTRRVERNGAFTYRWLHLNG